jgi:hypothetical protein
MANPFMMMAGKAPSLESVRTVALYDQGSGKIVHLHAEFTFVGGTRPSDAEIVAAARKRAARRHSAVESLGVAMSDNPEHARRIHRIDVPTKAFVSIPSKRPKVV